GVMKVCLFAPCFSEPPGNLTVPLPPGNVTVPLSAVGKGGAAWASLPLGIPPGSGAAVSVTARCAPWTTGAAVVGALSSQGSRHGPAARTSSTGDTLG